VFNNCYGQVAYGWQLSQKAYVLDNVANNDSCQCAAPVWFQTIYLSTATANYDHNNYWPRVIWCDIWHVKPCHGQL